MLVREQRGRRDDTEPVEEADGEPGPRRRAGRRCPTWNSRARRNATHAEAHGHEWSPGPVVLDVEERVEEVEARDPQATAAAEHHASHGAVPVRRATRRPGPGRAHAEPHVAEPREPLEVRVDDEQRDGDRPQPAHDRVELQDGDEEDDEAARTRAIDLPAGERPAGSSRSAVRGFRASSSASTRRLSAIASVRAPTIASVIQPTSRARASRRRRGSRRRRRTAARTPCARAGRATRNDAAAGAAAVSCLPCGVAMSPGASSRPCRSAGRSDREPVAAAAGRAREG